MAYKRNIILGGLMVLFASVFFLSRSQADNMIVFEGFKTGDTISSSYSMVHFGLPNGMNDYQGGVFWLPSIELKNATGLNFAGAFDPNKTRTCRKQIRGLYYNEQRGKRLWPMDRTSLAYLKKINSNYNDLQVDGGWYTTCTGGQTRMAGTDIYGQITFIDTSNGNSNETTLTAGLMYNVDNTISSTYNGFYPSLAYYNNERPIGYLFDSNGGVGFVGGVFGNNNELLGSIADGQGINDLFTGSTKSGVCYNGYCVNDNLTAGLDTAWYLSILGNTLLSRGGLDLINRQSVIGNIGSTSAIMFSDLINTSDILNELRRNASNLCVGKERISVSDFGADISGPIICIKNADDSTPLVIDLSNPAQYNGKDIIVQGENVILENAIPYDADEPIPTLNIFIDQGNLFLNPYTSQFNGTSYGDYRKFDISAIMTGFTGTASNSGWETAPKNVAYGQLLRGNIFVNGIVAGFSGDYTLPAPRSIPNKYYVYGRLASLNTALAPSAGRISMIQSMFPDEETLADYLSLSSDVFIWRCGLGADGVGTDLTPCATPGDFFKNSAFILMREYIPTKLFQ